VATPHNLASTNGVVQHLKRTSAYNLEALKNEARCGSERQGGPEDWVGPDRQGPA
jgi:hypothetical protein